MLKTYKFYAIICLYEDDMLILSYNDHMIKSTKKILTNKFDMKDLSVVNVITRVKIFRTLDRFILS
jgi:hypothetical protein